MILSRKYVFWFFGVLLNITIKCNSDSGCSCSDYADVRRLLFCNHRELMNYFINETHGDSTSIRQLLYAYNHECRYNRRLPEPSLDRRPFIVFEGNHRTSRKIIARKFSKLFGGSYLESPPRCLLPIRGLFPIGSIERRAYFTLSTYAMALSTRRVWNYFSVVTNGYWFEHHSYAIFKAFNEVPPPDGHEVYKWPEDLLKPDFTFFIDFPDNLHYDGTQRPANSWKYLVEDIFNKMNITDSYRVSTAIGFDAVLEELETVLKERLSHKFPGIGYKFRNLEEFDEYNRQERPMKRYKGFLNRQGNNTHRFYTKSATYI